MNWLSLSSSGGAGDELAEVVTRGSATSMGPNGWHPNPNSRGLWPVELCRARL
jgi:hypothetical protein